MLLQPANDIKPIHWSRAKILASNFWRTVHVNGVARFIGCFHMVVVIQSFQRHFHSIRIALWFLLRKVCVSKVHSWKLLFLPFWTNHLLCTIWKDTYRTTTVKYICRDMKILSWATPIFAVLVIFGTSCKKDVLNTDGALTFSVDTVLFDTVFTTIGSATRQFKIYNPSNNEVNISSIMLAGGQQSKYRINVDGVAGIAFSNISIPGKDSLFCVCWCDTRPKQLIATSYY